MYNDKRESFMESMLTRVPDWNNMNDDEKFTVLFKEHSRAFGKGSKWTR